MLMALVGFFQALKLTLYSCRLRSIACSTRFLAFCPNSFGAGVLLLVAWIVASLLRMLLRKALENGKRRPTSCPGRRDTGAPEPIPLGGCCTGWSSCFSCPGISHGPRARRAFDAGPRHAGRRSWASCAQPWLPPQSCCLSAGLSPVLVQRIISSLLACGLRARPA